MVQKSLKKVDDKKDKEAEALFQAKQKRSEYMHSEHTTDLKNSFDDLVHPKDKAPEDQAKLQINEKVKKEDKKSKKKEMSPEEKEHESGQLDNLFLTLTEELVSTSKAEKKSHKKKHKHSRAGKLNHHQNSTKADNKLHKKHKS